MFCIGKISYAITQKTSCLFLTGTGQLIIYGLVICLVYPTLFNSKSEIFVFTRWASFCYTFLTHYICSYFQTMWWTNHLSQPHDAWNRLVQIIQLLYWSVRCGWWCDVPISEIIMRVVMKLFQNNQCFWWMYYEQIVKTLAIMVNWIGLYMHECNPICPNIYICDDTPANV